jgi:hypothetical protein
MGSTLEFPWRHDGYELIRVVIARDLRDESRALLVAFRTLRQATTLDEVRAEAGGIAHAKGVHLTWSTEPDAANPVGHRITIAVVRA